MISEALLLKCVVLGRQAVEEVWILREAVVLDSFQRISWPTATASVHEICIR